MGLSEVNTMPSKSKNAKLASALALIATMNGALLKAEQPMCGISLMDDQTAVTEWLKRCAASPTDAAVTLIRDPEGLFGAGRSSGKPHQGVDIKLRQNSSNQCLDTRSYSADNLAVRAIAPGTVAYSRLNVGLCPKNCQPDKNPETDECPRECPPNRDPLSTTGLGLTIILDHGNGLYSLYAHLAQDRQTIQCLPDNAIVDGKTMPYQMGNAVKKGDIIGYIGKLGPEHEKWDKPTGNATQTNDPAQVHFEIFITAPGKNSKGAIKDIIDPSRRGILDPTDFLKKVLSDSKTKSSLSAPGNLKLTP